MIMTYISCLAVCCCLLTIKLTIAESNGTRERLYLLVPFNCGNIFDEVKELCNDVLCDMLENVTCICENVSCENVTCENVTCKNVSCEDVACENVTCENVTCRNVTCKNVTCGNVSCENVSCENVTCENVSCDVTCGNVTCENVTCKNVTCENVSCENVTCENVSCENVSCEEDVTFEKDCDQFKEKYDMVNKSFEAFKTLLDKTVINVFLREENKNKCMMSYRRWLCATQFTYRHNNATCKPGIGVCNEVVQNCPYYMPARHQNVDGCKREVIYGGLPAFMCPEEGTDDAYVYEDNNDIKFHCNCIQP